MLRAGKIFVSSWILFWQNIKMLLVGAVILAMLYVLIVSTISRSMEHNIGRMVQTFGLSQERYKELAARMEAGDEAATLEMMKEVNAAAEEYKKMTMEEREVFDEQRARKVAENLAPYFLLFGALSLFLFFCGSILSFVVYAEDRGSLIDIFHRCGALFFPMVSVWFWMFAKSFLWVLFLGFLPGLNLLLPLFLLFGVLAIFFVGPFLLFSPVLLVERKMKAKEAVQESIRLSKGYWGYIMGMIIIACILLFSVYVLASKVNYEIAQRLEGSAIFLGGIVQQLLLFFFVAFLISLLRSLPQQATE